MGSSDQSTAVESAAQAEKFLSYLVSQGDEPDEFIELRYFDGEYFLLSAWVPDPVLFPMLCREHRNEATIYAGILPRGSEKRGDEAVSSASVIFADIDVPDISDQDEARRQVEEGLKSILDWSDAQGLPKPMVVFSGRGYHVYWHHPRIALTEKNRQQVMAARRAFLYFLNKHVCDLVDLTVANLERVVRVPGTLNFKVDPPVAATIIHDGDPSPSPKLWELMEKLAKKSQQNEIPARSQQENEIDLSFLSSWQPDESRLKMILREHPQVAKAFDVTPEEKAKRKPGGDTSRSGMRQTILTVCVSALLTLKEVWHVAWHYEHSGLAHIWREQGQAEARRTFANDYGSARRWHEQQAGRPLVPTGSAKVQVLPIPALGSLCLEERGGMYGYTKATRHGPEWVTISNAVMQLREHTVFFEQNTKRHEYSGVTRVENGQELPIRISGEDFWDNRAFKAAWGNATNGSLITDDNKLSWLRNTIIRASRMTDLEVITQVGPVEGRGYLAPEFAVKDGQFVEHDGYSVVLPSGNKSLQRLGLSRIPDKHVRVVGHHILKRLVPLMGDQVALPLMAHAFIAPFHREPEIIRDINPCGVIVYGPSGIGKTTNGVYMQSFFGDFTNKTSLLNARSTANLIEDRGWWFNGALFVIDDFKMGLFSKSDTRQKMAVLQAAADGGSRERLTKDITERASKPIRGLVVVLAEDLPEGETSLLARYILVPFRKSKLAKEKLRVLKSRCDRQMKRYRGFMAAFIRWAQREWSPVRIRQEIIAGRDRIHGTLSGSAVENSERVAQNFALNRVGAVMLFGFLRNLGVIDAAGHDGWLRRYDVAIQVLLKETARLVVAEQPAEQFIKLLRELIATKAVNLGKNRQEPLLGSTTIQPPNMIGVLYGKGQVALFPDISYRHVNELFERTAGEQLPHNRDAVGRQLRDRKLLVRHEEGRTTTQITFGGRKQRVWLLNDATVLGEEDATTEQEDSESVDDLKRQWSSAIRHMGDVGDRLRKAKKQEGTYEPIHELLELGELRGTLSKREKEVRKESDYRARSEIDWLKEQRDDLEQKIKDVEKQEANRKKRNRRGEWAD